MNCKSCGASMGQYGVCEYCAPRVVKVKYRELSGDVFMSILDARRDAEIQGIKPTKAVLNPLANAQLMKHETTGYALANMRTGERCTSLVGCMVMGLDVIVDDAQAEALVVC